MRVPATLSYFDVYPSWDSVKKEIEPVTCVAGIPVKFDAEYTLLITFDQIPLVGRELVLEVLECFVRIVEHILAAVEIEGKRVGLAN
jgi:hypothetical protein